MPNDKVPIPNELQMSKVKGSEVQRFRGSGVQRFRGSRVMSFRDAQSKIHNWLHDHPKGGFLDFEVFQSKIRNPKSKIERELYASLLVLDICH
jgi:hypothetical protein